MIIIIYYNHDNFSKIEIKKTTRRSNENRVVEPLSPFYNSKLPSNDKKKKRLIALLEKIFKFLYKSVNKCDFLYYYYY